MGGAFTKTHDQHVLSLCRERKRLLKQALENRDAFAVAQCKYNNSLLTLSKAMRLFVAKHCSQSSQTNDKNSTFLPNKPTIDSVDSCPTSDPADSFTSSEMAEESQKQEEKTQLDGKQKGIVVEGGDGSEDDEVACRQFYDELVPEMASTEGETSYKWDFFDSYAQGVSDLGENGANTWTMTNADDIPKSQYRREVLLRSELVYRSVMGHAEVGVSHARVEVGSDEGLEESSNDLKAREKPKNKSVGGVKMEEEDDDENETLDATTAIETPETGKDFLKAFEQIEALFRTAYEAGLDVSKMLEATRLQQQTGLTENSNNIFWSIVRNRSSLTRRSSCQSVLPSPPPTNNRSRTGTAPMQTHFDEYPRMQFGSHSLSMAMLYQWERKLYKDVKMGENYRKLFERKCVALRKKEERDGFNFGDKTGLKVKALQARIWVAVECAQATSNKIIKVRDEAIEPQLFELLAGLMKMWKTISECHETQAKIMFEVAAFNNANGNFFSPFHYHATINLEAELKKWRASFYQYVSAQKAYLESLDAWFSACSGPEPEEVEEDSEEISSAPEFRIHRPPVISVCHKWLACMVKLPDKAVMSSLKSFGKEIKALAAQQAKEQKQKKEVQVLFRELDRKVSAMHRQENKILKLKESKREVDGDFQDRIELLEEKKISFSEFKQKIELEKVKHISGVEETHRATLAGFQKGFSAVLESLVDFSNASVKMYDDLSTYIDNANGTAENSGNIPSN